MSRLLAVRARRTVVGVFALVVLALGTSAVVVLPALAHAASYDLTGVWDTYGSGGAYTGTFTIQSFDASTGDFSGTGDGTTFILKGTEHGTSVAFTQSEGRYIAHDAASLAVKNGKLEMIGGVWHDSNGSGGTFTASIAGKAQKLSGTVVAACGRAVCSANGTPIANVDVTLTGGGAYSTKTNEHGKYSLKVPPGTYTVTPSAVGYVFTPPDRSVQVQSTPVKGQDFAGCGDPSLSATSASTLVSEKSCRNYVKITYDSATKQLVLVQWKARLECEVNGNAPVYDATVPDHHMFKARLPLALPTTVVGGVATAKVVGKNDNQDILTFTINTASLAGTVDISNVSSSVKFGGYPNHLTANGQFETCYPRAETLKMR